MWKILTSSNLNLQLKLFFYLPILTNNNLLFKIYCENIVVTFLNQHFFIIILFLLSLISFNPYVFFFLHRRLSLSLYLPLLFFLFLPHSRSAFILSFFTPALAICVFFFSYTFVLISLSPPSFHSFSPSFKNVLASALILFFFFFLQLSLSFFFNFLF